MTRILAMAALIALGWAHAPVGAAGGEAPMDKFPLTRSLDLPALQNGARVFANYCLSCHSANLMRWNRLADIGLEDKQIKEYLIFGNQKVGDTMSIALRPADAKAWFGKVPPDLSVIARARTSFEHTGPDYLYTLLRGYYRDAGSPTGWNNVVYPNIGMPHVMWERQGPREATIQRVSNDGKNAIRTVSVFDTAGQGRVTRETLKGAAAEHVEFSFKSADAAAARQFDADVADLVAYLVFMTDPGAGSRVRIGVWVLVFLTVFSVLAWWLNRTYWKDVK